MPRYPDTPIPRPPQLIAIFFVVIMLSRLIATLPAFKLFLYCSAGALGGAALVLPALYITYAANGGSWQESVTKV